MNRDVPILIAVLLMAGCFSAAAPPGESLVPTLEEGYFFSRDLWIDVPQLYHELDSGTPRQAWRVPFPRWLVIEEGWDGPESWGAWGLGERTLAHFYLRVVGPHDFFIDCKGPPHPAGKPQIVTVRVNGRAAGTFEAGPDWDQYRFPVPPELLREGSNELELTYAYALDDGVENDDRPLALGFVRLGLIAPEAEPAQIGKGSGVRLFSEQGVLVLESSGTYVAPLEFSRDAAEIAFGLSTSKSFGSTGESLLRFGLLDVDGGEETLGELSANDAGDHRFMVEHRAGRRQLLVFDAVLPPGHSLTIRHPRLVSNGDTAEKEVAPPPSAAPPNVVLLILDAARADHFGVYGYPRDTTPRIDALASEALVFRQAIAECSYTVCSTPCLLTGLSFVQHGVTGEHLILSDEIDTLAEILGRAGYRTLGLTGNPWNSDFSGTDQGFEEFHEVWEFHPEPLTDLLLERLPGQGGAPFFLMAHYVPPHEPYAPAPEFNVFGDPAYEGPVTPERNFTLGLYDKKNALGPADLKELVALYDGNLRMVDAALGRVVDRLRESGLYDDTLIVVTSDHGEAFQEHEYIGHNSTIYDEALHVPLILKLPRAWDERVDSGAVDLERLVTLADVPVTILRLLGLTVRDAVYARDLFLPAPAERMLFLRTAHKARPVLGVRTSRYKAMLREGWLPLFYDLAADPGETENVVDQHPVLHAGLGMFLARSVREWEHLRAGVRDGEISEEQERMLRALGYL